MKLLKRNNYYVLDDYYRQTIDLDTALDARHLVSVLASICPDIQCTYYDKGMTLNNVRNRMHQKIDITWKHQI